MFGEDIRLSDGDKIGSNCGGWLYDIQNDEFYEAASGCGGMMPFSVERNLYAAEMDSNHVYLHEYALVIVEKSQLFHIGDNGNYGDLIGTYESKVNISSVSNANSYEKYLAALEQYREDLKQEWSKMAVEYGDKFKWTFVWNGENYIFETLERI